MKTGLKNVMKKLPGIIVILSVFMLLSSIVLSFVYQDNPEDAFLFGLKAAYVSSDSMEPTIRQYALCVTKKIGYEDVKEDDILMFHIDDKLIVHRVVSVTEEGIRTKGDNSEMDDAFLLHEENVKSKVVFIWNGFADIILYIAGNPKGALKWSLVTVALVLAFLFGPEAASEVRKKVNNEVS